MVECEQHDPSRTSEAMTKTQLLERCESAWDARGATAQIEV
jgi:hypothetical protein